MFNYKPYLIVMVCLCIVGNSPYIYSTELQTSVKDLIPTEILFPSAFGSQLGTVVSPAGDIDGDGFRDFAVGAPSFEGIHINRLQDKGAVFIVYGNAVQQNTTSIDLSQNNAHYTLITGNQEYEIGNTIDSIGDFNNDGFQDISIGSKHGKNAFVIYGKDEYHSIISPDTYQSHGIMLSNTGKSLSSAGDFNGDNLPDVLFGNPQSEIKTKESQSITYGAFTLLFGGENVPNILNAFVSSENYLTTNRGLPNISFAQHVSGGTDYDNDGFSDIIITTQAKDKSEAYIVYGGQNVFSKGQADFGLTLEYVSKYVDTCSDINDDGFQEIIVGLPNNQALLMSGNENLRGTINLQENPQKWGTLFHGVDRLYSVGDLNGDGFGDIAAAMPQANVGNNVMAGQVLFLFGSPEFPNEIDIEDIRKGKFSGTDYVLVNGMQAFDVFGTSVAGIGDLQNDGFDDVIIGAPTQSLPGDSMQKQPGKAYVIQGIEFYYALQTHRSSFSQGSQQR